MASSKLHVLLLGPGNPSAANTGLGIVVDNIERSLGKLVQLSVIEPVELIEGVEEEEKVTNYESFSDSTVVQDIVHLSIKSGIAPYTYAYTGEKKGSSLEVIESELKKEFSRYSEAVINKGVKLDFDVIYAHDWISMDAAVKLKKQSGKPLVLHIHSLDVDRVGSNTKSWVYELEKEAIGIADAIIAVSKYSAATIADVYGAAKEKIHVVYPGLPDIEVIDEKTSPSDPTVLFLGRLCGQKGATVFVEIAEEVMARRSDVHFLMVGDGDLKADLLETVAQRNLSGNFHFNDFVPHQDIAEVFERTSVLCVPSVSEPFGLVAIEAAILGIPVVISKQAGAIEVLPRAVIVDNNDAAGFAEEIIKILDNKKLASGIIDANMKSVTGLGWPKSAKKIEKILNKAI